MNFLVAVTHSRFPVLMVFAILILPSLCWGQDYEVFRSEEYGFSMKYPATWKKIDNPRGNYYVVFQAPEMTDNFRNRIHIAAHKPVKDPLSVFLEELRNGIKDLQKKTGGEAPSPQVRILDEGEFRSEVPGAYYFFIQAYEPKLKLWMDIVIVFYKHQDTLLRISCLAPASMMEKYHAVFNDVLVSVKFDVQPKAEAPAGPAEEPSPVPTPREAPRAIERAPGGMVPESEESAPPPRPRAVQPPSPTQEAPLAVPRQPVPSTPGLQQEPEERPQPRAPRPGPGRGPSRQPERPSTGIVN
jgi:hypothetical protein